MAPAQKKSKKLPVRYVRPEGEERPEKAAKASMAARPVVAPAPSLKMYRRIAVGFVVAVALMLGAVLYVSGVSATIVVMPVKETVKAEFLADVVKTPTKETEVRGRVVSATVGKSSTFEPSGEGVEVEEKAGGTVVLYNVSSRPQPLVATTRLLSPAGVLFRLDSAVSVPANGSVEAGVHADLPGAAGNIGPSSFTIPGLNAARQKEVYAESKMAMTGGVRRVSVVSQSDIDRSALSLRSALEEEVKAVLREQVGTALAGEAFTFEIIEQATDVPAGTEASVFTLTMNVKATGVFFDHQALQTVAERKLYGQLASGKEFVVLDLETLQVTVDKVDLPAETANLRVYLDGQAVPSATSAALDPGNFVGLSASEVREKLVGGGVATDVSVQFTPFWVTTVPQLKDHVFVEIE
jgi:hypothetical protein